jgi:hypothetical protein
MVKEAGSFISGMPNALRSHAFPALVMRERPCNAVFTRLFTYPCEGPYPAPALNNRQVCHKQELSYLSLSLPTLCSIALCQILQVSRTKDRKLSTQPGTPSSTDVGIPRHTTICSSCRYSLNKIHAVSKFCLYPRTQLSMSYCTVLHSPRSSSPAGFAASEITCPMMVSSQLRCTLLYFLALSDKSSRQIRISATTTRDLYNLPILHPQHSRLYDGLLPYSTYPVSFSFPFSP